MQASNSEICIDVELVAPLVVMASFIICIMYNLSLNAVIDSSAYLEDIVGIDTTL